MGTAEALLASSDPEGEPDWIYWFTVGELHGIVGQTYLLAHEPETAVGHLHQGIEETGEEFARDRAAYLADMATAQVLNGDLDESRHTAERALEILSGDLNSGRVVELLTNYCGTLRTQPARRGGLRGTSCCLPALTQPGLDAPPHGEEALD